MNVSVDTLRWLVFMVTIGVIGGVGWAAFDFAFGPRPELARALPDASGFVVQPRADERLDPKELNKVIRTLLATKPLPPPVAEKTEIVKPRAGGPLEDAWEPTGMFRVGGAAYVTIREKQDKPAASARSGRGSERSTRGRRPTRRASRAKQIQTRFFPVPGGEFTIEGKIYTGVSHAFDEDGRISMTYASGRREYTILGPEVDTQIREEVSDAPEGIAIRIVDGIPTDPDEAKRKGVDGKTRSFADPSELAPPAGDSKDAGKAPAKPAAKPAAGDAKQPTDDAKKKAQEKAAAEKGGNG